MAVNKVVYGNSTIIDITDTSAATNDVIEGQVFYSASGARSVGTLTDATQSTHGLMSAADKTIINNLSTTYAPIASPIFTNNGYCTGNLYVNTNADGTGGNQVATETYVNYLINQLCEILGVTSPLNGS